MMRKEGEVREGGARGGGGGGCEGRASCELGRKVEINEQGSRVK